MNTPVCRILRPFELTSNQVIELTTKYYYVVILETRSFQKDRNQFFNLNQGFPPGIYHVKKGNAYPVKNSWADAYLVYNSLVRPE